MVEKNEQIFKKEFNSDINPKFLEPMKFCDWCGRYIPHNLKFCDKCPGKATTNPNSTWKELYNKNKGMSRGMVFHHFIRYIMNEYYDIPYSSESDMSDNENKIFKELFLYFKDKWKLYEPINESETKLIDLIPGQTKNMSKDKKDILKKSGDRFGIELMRNESASGKIKLYHATFSGNVESILEHGLLHNQRKNYPEWSESDYIYFATSEKHALNWILDLWKEELEKMGDITNFDDIAIFSVILDKDKLDEDMGTTSYMYNAEINGDIPPKDLKLETEYETKLNWDTKKITTKKMLNENTEKKNSYFYIGRNPTLDLVVLKDNNKKILLIKRGDNVEAESGKWALPGGFQNSSSKKGETFTASETPIDGAIRELKEETGLDLSEQKELFKRIGTFEGNGRDPRDNFKSWSFSTAFLISLPNNLSSEVQGMDDASDAKWVDLTKLKSINLAFDHKRIILRGLRLLCKSTKLPI